MRNKLLIKIPFWWSLEGRPLNNWNLPFYSCIPNWSLRLVDKLLKSEHSIAVRMKNHCDVSILRVMTTDKKAHAFSSLTLSGFKSFLNSRWTIHLCNESHIFTNMCVYIYTYICIYIYMNEIYIGEKEYRDR